MLPWDQHFPYWPMITGYNQTFSLSGEMVSTREHLALEVLQHWSEMDKGCELMPDHIETRALFDPNKIGVEQVS